MNKVLMLKSSILGDHSQSSALIDHLSMLWSDKGHDITHRDLAAEPIPMLDAEIMMGFGGGDNLSERQQQALSLSNTLIDEIKEADTLVIGAPMYNFNIPAQLKAWIDFIARAGVTFKYTETGPQGLITGKRAIIVTTRGGMHKDAGTDHVTPYLKTVLGFIGITDVEVIYAEGLSMGEQSVSTAIANAKEQLAGL